MQKTTNYTRIRFPRCPHDQTLQAMLIAQEPLGFLEDDAWWEVYFEADQWPSIEAAFAEAMRGMDITAAYETQVFAQENWNSLWEESIQPIRVSDRFLIAPSWHPVEADGDTITLIIDPKMSFGTGYHATTRLMLRLLDGSVAQGDHVLDVGTGTGVLAIAAVMLGAARAEGVDTDEWSYDNALENAQRNGVEERVLFSHGSIEHAVGPYDVILSNITKIDNLQMLPRLEAMLRPGGMLILSGFYAADERDVRLALEQLRFTHIDGAEEDEWMAVRANKERP